MLQQIETIKAAAAANARMVAQDATTYSQAVILKVADGVAEAKRPATALFDAGLKLNQIAYGAAAELLAAQKDAVIGAVDGGVTRLRTAADAQTLRAFWEGQVALYPAGLSRMKQDYAKALGTLKGAGTGIKRLATETRDALYSDASATPEATKPAPVRRKKAVRKAHKTVAKKAVRKAATKAKRRVAKKVETES
jgi:hypothetical protein